MTTEKVKKEIVDTTEPTKSKLVGVDCGTMHIVLAEQNPESKEIEISNIRNMYLPLDKSQLTMAELSNIDYVETDESIFIIGEDAYKFGNMFGQIVKRPMSKGLISPNEVDGVDVLTLMIQQLVGKTYDGHAVYSVPSASVDRDNNILYHQEVFKRIFTELGYTSEPFNEAMAIIYSQCQDNKFTGLAFSYGAGMCLRGDTEIPLLNGTTLTLKEMAEYDKDKTFWVFSCKEDGSIVPGLARNVHKVKTSNLIRVWLDNDKYVDVTEDHKFMLRDGTYKEAKDLEAGQSLMPLYLHDQTYDGRSGYFSVYDNKERKMKEACNNHKVVKIEDLKIQEDVYDMTVDKYHNFAVSSGVFVHNCNIALSYKSVPIITFSVARSGDWIDEQSALSLGTIPNRITSIKEKGTDLSNFKIGNKKERRVREAIVYYYREVIRYSLEKVKAKLDEATGELELREKIPLIISGGTSLAKGFIPLFKDVIKDFDEFPIEIEDIKHVEDPLSAVAEGLLIRGMIAKKGGIN